MCIWFQVGRQENIWGRFRVQKSQRFFGLKIWSAWWFLPPNWIILRCENKTYLSCHFCEKFIEATLQKVNNINNISQGGWGCENKTYFGCHHLLIGVSWGSQSWRIPGPCRPLPRRSLRLKQCCQSDSLGKGWESGLANLARHKSAWSASEMEGLYVETYSP